MINKVTKILLSFSTQINLVINLFNKLGLYMLEEDMILSVKNQVLGVRFSIRLKPET